MEKTVLDTLRGAEGLAVLGLAYVEKTVLDLVSSWIVGKTVVVRGLGTIMVCGEDNLVHVAWTMCVTRVSNKVSNKE